MTIILLLLMCHCIGDYVLQIDFLAKTKGTNLYHLFVHCILYLVPFAMVFGIDWHIGILFVSHFIIDTLKAKYQKINYATDQLLHYFVLLIYYKFLHAILL